MNTLTRAVPRRPLAALLSAITMSGGLALSACANIPAPRPRSSRIRHWCMKDRWAQRVLRCAAHVTQFSSVDRVKLNPSLADEPSLKQHRVERLDGAD